MPALTRKRGVAGDSPPVPPSSSSSSPSPSKRTAAATTTTTSSNSKAKKTKTSSTTPSPAPSSSNKKKKKGSTSSSKAAPQEKAQEEKEPEIEEGEAPLFWIDTEAGAAAAAAPAEEEEEEEEDEEDEPVTLTIPRRNNNKQQHQQEKGEEELELERLVFGGQDTATLFQHPHPQEEEQEEEEEDNRPTSKGKKAQKKKQPPKPAWQDEDDEEIRVDIARKDRLRKLRRDPGEKDISGADYQERLRARFQETNKSALSWAALPVTPEGQGKANKTRHPDDSSSSDDEEEDQAGFDNDDSFADLFRSTAPLVATTSTHTHTHTHTRKLQPGTLEVLRCRDANLQEPSQAVVQALQFHPSTGGLLLTGGLDKTLRFFQVDGKKNDKVAGVFFPDLPIQSAAFVDSSGNGQYEHVIVSGRRPFFYWYDTVSGATGRINKLMGREEKSLERFVASPDGQWLAFTGKDGYVLLVSAKSKQWAGEFKMNGTARALAFSADGRELVASGGDAVVYRWDVRSSKCLARFANEGGTVTSSLAVSSGGMTAVGAESGVVNLYADEDYLVGGYADTHTHTHTHADTHVAPVKALTNLVTTVDSLAFNHDGQLLAMASKWNRDALRMVHVPTRTVFSNWPTGQTPIRYPSALAFSPNSGMFAVGNDRGKVLLYRLRHYDAS